MRSHPKPVGAPGNEQEAAAIISNHTNIHPHPVAPQDERPGCEKPSTQGILDTHFPDPISPKAMELFFLKLGIPLWTF